MSFYVKWFKDRKMMSQLCITSAIPAIIVGVLSTDILVIIFGIIFLLVGILLKGRG